MKKIDNEMALLKMKNRKNNYRYYTVGGLFQLRFTLHYQLHESSAINETPWRALLPSAGERSVTLTAEGYTLSKAGKESLEQWVWKNDPYPCQIYFQNRNKIEGVFLIGHYTRIDANSERERFVLSLESTGNVAFIQIYKEIFNMNIPHTLLGYHKPTSLSRSMRKDFKILQQYQQQQEYTSPSNDFLWHVQHYNEKRREKNVPASQAKSTSSLTENHENQTRLRKEPAVMHKSPTQQWQEIRRILEKTSI